jgi:hypothetical protein
MSQEGIQILIVVLASRTTSDHPRTHSRARNYAVEPAEVE